MSSLDSALVDAEILRPPLAPGLSRTARLLNIEAYVWSRANHTDGVIPDGQLRWVTDEPDADSVAAELISAGVWARTTGGWSIVRFLDSQMSAERVANRVASNRDRYERYLARQGGKRQRAGSGAAATSRSGRATRPAARQRVGNGVDNAAKLTEPKGREAARTGIGSESSLVSALAVAADWIDDLSIAPPTDAEVDAARALRPGMPIADYNGLFPDRSSFRTVTGFWDGWSMCEGGCDTMWPIAQMQGVRLDGGYVMLIDPVCGVNDGPFAPGTIRDYVDDGALGARE